MNISPENFPVLRSVPQPDHLRKTKAGGFWESEDIEPVSRTGSTSQDSGKPECHS
jgi:hypothetical protein